MKPIRPKEPVEWPKRARIAVLLTFDFQAEEGVPLLPGGFRNYQELTDRQYGGTRGIYRVLRILNSFGVPATFRVCGRTAQKYPEAIRAIKEAGHELGGHGWAHELLDGLPPDEEKQVIERTVQSIGDVSGEQIRGWRSPHARPSPSTAAFLMDMGFEWRSDLMDSDLPYRLGDGKKSLIEIPHTWATSDTTLYNPSQIPAGIPQKVLAARVDEFAMLYEEGKKTPRMISLTLHPFASGRPARAHTLADFVRHVQGFPDIWFARCTDVARWWTEKGY